MNLEQVFQKGSFSSLLRVAIINREARRLSMPVVEKKK